MSEALIGKLLPDLELPFTKRGETGSLKIPEDFQGKWTILYFYPKDDTPGCTKQACSYQDQSGDWEKQGIAVYGVSLDDPQSHHDFAEKFSLGFPLIVDRDHLLSEALGVYGDQTWKEKTFKGLSRDSFLLDPEGKVQKIWRKVNPESSPQETLKAARGQLG